jgi:hypothetical protein
MRNHSLLAFIAATAILCTASFAKTPPAGGSGFAVVESNGALVRGTALSAVRSGVGTYSVEFAHAVKKCVFTATTGSTTTGTPPNGYVTVAGSGGDANGVFVATYDFTGTPADFSFHLNVRC